MSQETGLRERKKRRTRRELAEAALRLFDQQGYEATTVAQIASEAEVSTKTFFAYFPSKPDVLFAEPHERVDAAVAIVKEIAPDQPAGVALQRAVTALYAPDPNADPDLGLLRQRLIATEPAVQARALFHTLEASTRLADALCEAYDELDRVDVVAGIGSIVGSMIAVLYDSVKANDTIEQMRDSARRAAEAAFAGITDTMRAAPP